MSGSNSALEIEFDFEDWSAFGLTRTQSGRFEARLAESIGDKGRRQISCIRLSIDKLQLTAQHAFQDRIYRPRQECC